MASDKLVGTVCGSPRHFKSLGYDVFIGEPSRKPRNFRASAQSAGFNLVDRY